jgi:hypothetical protein
MDFDVFVGREPRNWGGGEGVAGFNKQLSKIGGNSGGAEGVLLT